MPAFDGTGPRGKDPMTGRGEGYCAVRLPSPESGQVPYGYAGRASVPVRLALKRRLRVSAAPGRGRRGNRQGRRLFRRRR